MRVTVTGKSGAAEFDCAPREHLLRAGLSAGFALPYECASGTCGSCKATVVAGETDYHWSDAPGRKYCKPARNEILMCQAHPLSDCTLTVSGAVGPLPPAAVPRSHAGSIRNYRRLNADVCVFEVELDASMCFEAGQFALIEHDGVEGARSYSMTNYAPEVRAVHFLVKRFPSGGFSEFLFERDVEGERVSVFGPLGRATFAPELERPVVFIAGGSGIAGFRSILIRAAEARYFARHDGQVFFGFRTADDGFWLDELAAFARDAGGGLTVTIALSHEDPSDELRARYPELAFARGFVHEVAGQAMQGKYDKRMAYVAGPPPMVDAALRMLLLDAKLGPANIRYDKFS